MVIRIILVKIICKLDYDNSFILVSYQKRQPCREAFKVP